MQIIKALILSHIILPFVSFAQPFIPTPGVPIGPIGGYGYGGYGGGYGGYGGRVGFRNIEDVVGFMRTLIGYGQVIIFLIALVFFLTAAFKFIKGDAAGGRDTLLWAVVGVVVALLAFTIIPVVCALLGANTPACNI